MFKTLLLTLSCTGYSVIVFCQATPDTLFLQASILGAKKIYDTSIERQLNIYNGRDYKLYNPIGEEHPYYQTDDWALGSILYEGDFYTSIPLLLDLSTDKVLTENPANGAKMELASSKIDSFTIHGQTFIRLANATNFSSDMAEGFYELLYDGRLKLYARRKKNIQEKPSGLVMTIEFIEKSKYFLFTGSQYIRVNGKSSLIQALGGKKQFPKSSGERTERFSDNKTEDALIYYTQLYDQAHPSL